MQGRLPSLIGGWVLLAYQRLESDGDIASRCGCEFLIGHCGSLIIVNKAAIDVIIPASSGVERGDTAGSVLAQ